MGHIELSAELQLAEACASGHAEAVSNGCSKAAILSCDRERQQSGNSCSTSNSSRAVQPITAERRKAKPSSVRSRAAFFEAMINSPPASSPPWSSTLCIEPPVGSPLRIVGRHTLHGCCSTSESAAVSVLKCGSEKLHVLMSLHVDCSTVAAGCSMQKQPLAHRSMSERLSVEPQPGYAAGQEVEMVDQGAQVDPQFVLTVLHAERFSCRDLTSCSPVLDSLCS